ncbi:hypothetical protein ACVBEG_02980 [Pseudomonas sp. GG8]
MKIKVYPLEIEAVHTDDERIYMSKGHHNPHEFMKALREYGTSTQVCTPTHEMVKRVPAGRNSDHSCFFHFVDKGTRGAFPATYAREYGEDVYQPSA